MTNRIIIAPMLFQGGSAGIDGATRNESRVEIIQLKIYDPIEIICETIPAANPRIANKTIINKITISNKDILIFYNKDLPTTLKKQICSFFKKATDMLKLL